MGGIGIGRAGRHSIRKPVPGAQTSPALQSSSVLQIFGGKKGVPGLGTVLGPGLGPGGGTRI